MDNMDSGLWIVLAVYFAVGIYGYQAFRQWFSGGFLRFIYILGFVGVAGGLYYYLWQLADGHISTLVGTPGLFLGGFLAFFVFGAVLALFMLIEDVFRVIQYIMNHIVGLDHEGQSYMPGRRKFMSGLGLLLASVPFGSLLYGMYKGRFEYKIFKEVLEFEDLPEAFDGFTITQLSDFHGGSFDSDNSREMEEVIRGIAMANALDSDLVVFTGDMVNDATDEMLPWSHVFGALEAREGKLAVLGNHDYGDYREWNNDQEKEMNFEELLVLHGEMGFDTLRNEHRILERDGQQLAIVGCENWGEGRFVKKGDLDRATEGLDDTVFKVLLSHDPSHWRAQVLGHEKKFQLTLSGHTHGFQFGVELPEYGKWSPVQYRYPEWAGLYEKDGKYIYVNRGFGFIGYPGRVGIWPEITHITLKKKVL